MGMPDPRESDVDLIRRERDLYLRLLELGAKDEMAPFLEEALAILVEAAGAHQGYLQLGVQLVDGGAPQWWAAHGFSGAQLEAIRSSISRGIVAEALKTGRTIVTGSALHDERYGARESVRKASIEAVLCAPVGQDPPLGVLYLQRRLEPGPFSEADRRRIEAFARHLAPFVDRLLVRLIKVDEEDPTRPYRIKLHCDGLVGRSESFAAVLRDVVLVAPLDVEVFLSGETGTGKSQIARVIHQNSARAAGPFVELNCAAIPEALVESELFGAMPGSHSTASRRLVGKVAAAARGTLFLDEVGELSHAAQAKLLQLLQSRTYYPLGATVPERADVRVIAATNTDLQAAVDERRFRDDLFYRLHVLPIRLPPLTERREDIPELARTFCASACERHRLPRVTLSEDAVRALQASEWPGNVRQLAHTVEAAAIRVAGSGLQRVEREMLFPKATSKSAGEDNGERLTFQESTRRYQAGLLKQTLEESGWNIVEASRRLELTRSHVYTLMRAFGLTRKS